MNVYTTSTREIFTPGLDRFTMGKFQGNHRDLLVSFSRNGDRLTVAQSWGRDTAGHFTNREERVFSVSAMVEDLAQVAKDNGLSFQCADDLPEGFSLAVTPA